MPKEKPTLEEFMAQITEENSHEEIDFGRPVGKEFGSDEEDWD